MNKSRPKLSDEVFNSYWITTRELIRVLAGFNCKQANPIEPFPKWYYWLFNATVEIDKREGEIKSKEYYLWKIGYPTKLLDKVGDSPTSHEPCLVWNRHRVIEYLYSQGIIEYEDGFEGSTS